MPPPASVMFSPTPTQPLISFATIFNDPSDPANQPRLSLNPLDGSLGLFLIMLFVVITLLFLSAVILWRVYNSRMRRAGVNALESESGAGYSVSAEKAILRALSAGGAEAESDRGNHLKMGKEACSEEKEKKGGLRKLILPSLVKSSDYEQAKTTTRAWSFLSLFSPNPQLSSASSVTDSSTATSESHPSGQTPTVFSTHNDLNTEILGDVPEIRYEAPTPTIPTPPSPSSISPLVFNMLYVPGSRPPPFQLPTNTTIFIPSDINLCHNNNQKYNSAAPQELPPIFRSTPVAPTPKLPLSVLSNQTGQPFELAVAPTKHSNVRRVARKQGHMRTPSQHSKENFPGLSVAAAGVEGRRQKHVSFSSDCKL